MEYKLNKKMYIWVWNIIGLFISGFLIWFMSMQGETTIGFLVSGILMLYVEILMFIRLKENLILLENSLRYQTLFGEKEIPFDKIGFITIKKLKTGGNNTVSDYQSMVSFLGKNNEELLCVDADIIQQNEKSAIKFFQYLKERIDVKISYSIGHYYGIPNEILPTLDEIEPYTRIHPMYFTVIPLAIALGIIIATVII